MKEELQKPVDPDSIPMEDRVGTLTIVWAKDGRVAIKFPKELHISLKMMSVLMDHFSMIEREKFKQIQELAKEMEKQMPGSLIKAPAGSIPSFNANLLKKPFES